MAVVVKKDEVPAGTAKCVEVDGKSVALFNVGGSFYAIDDICGHAGGPLSEGEISGSEVTCPWHGAVYDVRTGKACPAGPFRNGAPDSANVKVYRIAVDGSDLKIEG